MLIVEIVEWCQEAMQELDAEQTRLQRALGAGWPIDLEHYGRVAALESLAIAMLAIACAADEQRPRADGTRES